MSDQVRTLGVWHEIYFKEDQVCDRITTYQRALPIARTYVLDYGSDCAILYQTSHPIKII